MRIVLKICQVRGFRTWKSKTNGYEHEVMIVIDGPHDLEIDCNGFDLHECPQMVPVSIDAEVISEHYGFTQVLKFNPGVSPVIKLLTG